MDQQPQPERVVVALAAKDVQAEMMVEALAAKGIEGSVLGAGDAGIPVAVRPADADAAIKALRRGPPELPTVKAPPGADYFADRAYRWSLRWWLFFVPAVILTAIHLAHAIRAERVRPPADLKRFRRKLWLAFLVGIVLPVGGAAILAAWAVERFL